MEVISIVKGTLGSVKVLAQGCQAPGGRMGLAIQLTSRVVRLGVGVATEKWHGSNMESHTVISKRGWGKLSSKLVVLFCAQAS